MRGWLKIKSAAQYCDVSPRTFRTWLKGDYLRRAVINGTIYLKIEWIDEFLEKHEPKLAEKTKKLREEDPRKFRRQVMALGRLYGPVMRQMQANPKMGKLLMKTRI